MDVLRCRRAGALVVIGRRHAHVSLRPGPGEVPMHVPDDVGFPDDHSGRRGREQRRR